MLPIPTSPEILAFEAAGLVTVRPHNTLPLRIVNYTPKAQFERRWTPALRMCRGLVFDANWNLVARPLPKFFNYEEHLGDDPPAGPLPTGPYTVTEKYDGSLGIVFRWQEHLLVATRGSFHSDQARMGWELLNARYRSASLRSLDEGITHLFEIIHPENRIVVDYGGDRYMQWLTSIRVSDGVEQPHYGVLFGHPDSYPPLPPDELKRESRPNAEGYVLRYATGQRVKIKFDDYVRLHALVTGLDTVRLWEELRAGRDPLTELQDLPDELYGWAQREVAALKAKFHAQQKSWGDEYEGIIERMKQASGHTPQRRKEFAQWAMDCANPSALFLILDNNWARYDALTWDTIKPQRQRPTATETC